MIALLGAFAPIVGIVLVLSVAFFAIRWAVSAFFGR